MFEKFTDRARRVVVLAQEEVRLHNHDHIGTEHLLLGLIREGDGVAVRALESLEISPAAVRYEVEEMIGRGEQAPTEPIPFTSRAKTALELSLRESRRLGDGHIGTGHILLGLISEGGGAAAQVLAKLGADLDRVRTRVVYPGREPASTGAEPLARESGTGYLASRVRTVESQLSGLEARFDAIESRLSAAEFCVGVGPDMRGLDKEIAQTRRDKEAARGERDFEAATSLHDKEQQLIGEKDSRRRQWEAVHLDPSSLAEKIGQLSDEIEQLRGLIRQQGTEPKEGTA